VANRLFYGDNLDILRRTLLADESVDLIYLDPPFKSNVNYNVIFKDNSGGKSDVWLDTWQWSEKVGQVYEYLTNRARHRGKVPDAVSTFVIAIHDAIGIDDEMTAYVVAMAVRLIELKRVLKLTGSIYLHCDSTASHYLRLLMDAIFGAENFRNEIVWRRTGSNSANKRFGPIHQTILYYVKSKSAPFYPVYGPYTKGYVRDYFTYEDLRGRYRPVLLTGPGLRKGDSGKAWRAYDPSRSGRHWQPATYVYDKYHALTGNNLADHPLIERLDKLDAIGLIHWAKKVGGGVPNYKYYLADAQGVALQDIWAYVPGTEGCVVGNDDECIDQGVKWLSTKDRERLAYPTQKPEGVLERIIRASSREGDVVLDPFCGCGTTIAVAQRLKRQWLGIDVTYLAIGVIKERLRRDFGITDVQVINSPTEPEGVRQMALSPGGRYQVQWWALDKIGAQSVGGLERKGADRGIDGTMTFTEADGQLRKVLVSVKSGHVTSSMLRDLGGAMVRDGAAMGVFITLESPTPQMRLEAIAGKAYHSVLYNRDYPRIQILTTDELLQGKRPRLPDTPSVVRIPSAAQPEQLPLPADSAGAPSLIDRQIVQDLKTVRRRNRVASKGKAVRDYPASAARDS
jgi:DNA modification methylase